MAKHDQLTIVSVHGHNDGSSALLSIEHSMKQLPGSRGLLLSLRPPENLPDGIEWRQIYNLDYAEYSVFMMHCLGSFIETDYCLVVQDDGWVLNGENWKDEYYDYDYIGAPSHCGFSDEHIYLHFSWARAKEPVYVVQNGGFSLRSKKLLEVCNKNGIAHQNGNDVHYWNEDAQLSALLKPVLEECGMRFAPLELAKHFSVEYIDSIFHADTDFKKLVGHHAQSRKLISPMHVRMEFTWQQANQITGEARFAELLQELGYTVEWKLERDAEERAA